MANYSWPGSDNIQQRAYRCGHCDKEVGSNNGYAARPNHGGPHILTLFICPLCERPSLFDWQGNAIPSPKVGDALTGLPKDIEAAYGEARTCASHGAPTAATMICRKILLYVAVEKKVAGEKDPYQDCVNKLATAGYFPPDAKEWVDRIRQLGNEGNHKLEQRTAEDASDALTFTAMLLKHVYEFPSKLKPKKP